MLLLLGQWVHEGRVAKGFKTIDWAARAGVSRALLERIEQADPGGSKVQDAKATLRVLFGRIVFNILCGSTDDHARQHAAFWDGRQLTLTPAYAICPQARSGQEATQAMLIQGPRRTNPIATCLDAAGVFLPTPNEALGLLNGQIDIIERDWLAMCLQAKLSAEDRNYFWRRQCLNPFVFFGAPSRVRVPQSSARSPAHCSLMCGLSACLQRLRQSLTYFDAVHPGRQYAAGVAGAFACGVQAMCVQALVVIAAADFEGR